MTPIRPFAISFLFLPFLIAQENNIQSDRNANVNWLAYQALRLADFDGRTVDAAGLTLQKDAHQFAFESGAFYFLQPIGGRTIGAVFIGEGGYRLTPASANERRQLWLHTGKELETLDDRFSHLLLLFTDDTFEQLTKGRELGESAAMSETRDVLADFRKLEASMARDVSIRLADALLNRWDMEQDVFVAHFEGRALSSAIVAIDPLGVAKTRLIPGFRLGSETSVLFMADRDRAGIPYLSHLAQDVASGAWQQRREPFHVDALSYRIETAIDRSERLSGVTRLQFRTLIPKLVVLPVDIEPELVVTGAKLIDSQGTEQPLATSAGPDLALIFPEALELGDIVTVEIAYGGKNVVNDAGGGNFSVGARTNWHPTLGAFQDRAAYHLTFRLPKGKQLVSVGKLVENREEDDVLISVWESRAPLTVAGFNYGDFDVQRQKEEYSGLDLALFSNKRVPDYIAELNMYLQSAKGLSGSGQLKVQGAMPSQITTDSLASGAMIDAINSLRLYSASFGPLPYDRIALTQQPEMNFGQAWPTLIFMPYAAFINRTQRQMLGLGGMNDFIDEVCAHEIAHQWWGHQISAASYRDQWLEEGFAEFSSALFIQKTRGWDAQDDFWERAAHLITNKFPGNNYRNCDVAPIIQGYRMMTDRSPLAYQAMVYTKGGFVLHMLRMMMFEPTAPDPDADFLAMMRDFHNTYAGRAVSTHDFKTLVERHIKPVMNATGDGKMDWFFDQWVHGMEIPTYKTEVDIKSKGKGLYRLKASIVQEGVSENFRAMVPLYVDFGKGQTLRLFQIPFKGPMRQKIDQTIKLPKKPKKILINAHYDVLAHQ